MLDINEIIENILINNRIIKRTSLDHVIGSMRNLRERSLSGSTIGIYGAGGNTDNLLLFMEKAVGDFCIDYCFDKKVKSYSYKNFIKNTNVLSINDLQKKNVDFMILGSRTFRKEMKETLESMGYRGTIVDFYDLMEDYLGEHISNYKIIYNKRKKYECSVGEERIKALRELIREYLIIRDFNSAFQYIDKYIENQYEDFERYQKLKKELSDLFVLIKRYLEKRNCNDIVINWIDALSYIHLRQFPFLQEKARQGINFEKAYSVNPWTRETMKTIFWGEYSIEGKLFQKDKFGTNETKLLKMLKRQGYRFSYLGLGKYKKLLDEEAILSPELNFEREHNDSSIPRQWDALCLLCKEEGPLCLLIDTLWETHEPFVCGEIEPYQEFTCSEKDWEKEECRAQAEVSSRYVDKQFAFYDNLLGSHITKIYISVHGRISDSIMKESRIHTVLIIDAPEQKQKAVKGIVSLVDFWKIVEKCITGDMDFQEIEREYTFVESFDYYNYSSIRAVLDDSKYNIFEYLQRRGVITLEDRFCRFAYGKESYFTDGDDKTDRINEEKYTARIAELRELCGTEFIDIFQYDKFKYSRLLYTDEQLSKLKERFRVDSDE